MSPILGIYASQISGHLWEPAGAYDALWSTTLSASASSITISNIPSTYKHLQIRGFNKDTSVAAGTQVLSVQFNSDTAANYSYHRLTGTGSAVSVAGVSGASLFYTGSTITNVANTFGTFVLDILDYKDTNKYKTARSLDGSDANGSGEISFRSGSWRSTSAITSVTLTATGTAIAQYSSIALYGIN